MFSKKKNDNKTPLDNHLVFYFKKLSLGTLLPPISFYVLLSNFRYYFKRTHSSFEN